MAAETGEEDGGSKAAPPCDDVRITFDLPPEAAIKLSQLAHQSRELDDRTLSRLGILSVQLEGGQASAQIFLEASFCIDLRSVEPLERVRFPVRNPDNCPFF